MSWQGVVTNQGAALLAAWAGGGHMLHIDGATVGSGITEAANMRIATALAHSEANASIIKKEPIPGGTKYKIQVGPASTAAYTAHEIGLWAHLDNDSTSVLLALHQDAGSGVDVPLASVSPAFFFALYITHAISNDGTVTVNIDDSANVSQATLEDALDEVQQKYDDALASIGLYVDNGAFYILNT